MKLSIAIISVLLISTTTFAQKENINQNKTLQLDFGKCFHGTGDLRGFAFDFEYKKYFRKRISISFGLGTTIHDGKISNWFSDSAGRKYDGSYRYTTAGVQFTSKLGMRIINRKKHDFGIQLGGVLRYQTTSIFDDINIFFPALTGYPYPLALVVNTESQRTFAIGGIGQIYYNYTITKNMFLGLSGTFQTDSNGDALRGIGLTCGFKL